MQNGYRVFLSALNSLSELTLDDMHAVAASRGGECLSSAMTAGDMATKLEWRCAACGTRFEASPSLILLGGHWCPECLNRSV